MVSRRDAVRFLVEEYYEGDAGRAAKASGFSKQQITNWLNGTTKPQKFNLGHLFHTAFAPEFRVIAEYRPVQISSSDTSIRVQLKHILKGHEKSSGIYGFYDSMSNLVYIGKSDGNLLDECYQQIRAPVRSGVFPKGAKQPTRRLDVVRYVSAYYVRGSDFEDYAKHVESLILRISKPVLNTNIGKLAKAGAG